MNNRALIFRSYLAALFAAAMMLVLSTGCASESIARNVNYTHWHDENTIVFVYDRVSSAGTIAALFSPMPRTTHVLICLVDDENAVQCKEQRQIANMLNPHAVDLFDLDDRWQP